MSATQHQRLLWYFSCPNNRSNACCNTSSKTSSKHIGAAFAVRGREDGWGSARYRFLFLPLAWIHCLWSMMGHMTRGWQDKLKPCMWFSDSPVMFAVCYCQCRAGQGGLTRTWARPAQNLNVTHFIPVITPPRRTAPPDTHVGHVWRCLFLTILKEDTSVPTSSLTFS